MTTIEELFQKHLLEGPLVDRTLQLPQRRTDFRAGFEVARERCAEALRKIGGMGTSLPFDGGDPCNFYKWQFHDAIKYARAAIRKEPWEPCYACPKPGEGFPPCEVCGGEEE
jgi:hypothetical protein